MAVSEIAEPPPQPTHILNSQTLLDVLERALHAGRSEWLFFRELRVGTGLRNSSAQRLDAFALNCFPHTGMKRVCYEIKISRADFLSELKRPLKRRIGMRFSNEFYFVTPKGLLQTSEIPSDCGLIEIGFFSDEERKTVANSEGLFFWFDPACNTYCIVTAPACWRDTPGPTWQFLAAALRNQRKEFEEKPPLPAKQQKLPLAEANDC